MCHQYALIDVYKNVTVPVLMKLRFYVPLDTKQVISETFFLANLLA